MWIYVSTSSIWAHFCICTDSFSHCITLRKFGEWFAFGSNSLTSVNIFRLVRNALFKDNRIFIFPIGFLYNKHTINILFTESILYSLTNSNGCEHFRLGIQFYTFSVPIQCSVFVTVGWRLLVYSFIICWCFFSGHVMDRIFRNTW